jgi:hypothetical protein
LLEKAVRERPVSGVNLRRVMAADKEKHVADFRMLPVLIEQDSLSGQNTTGGNIFTSTIRGQIRYLIDATEPPPEALVTALLKKKRILVIIDGFSELTDEARNHISPNDPNFPIHALILTSRLGEKPTGIEWATIEPLRIQGNRLSSFMDAYLSQCGKRHLFDDPEFFNLCRNLSLMVSSQDIAVLFAKLYADHIAASKENLNHCRVAETIPDLVLEYLNAINPNLKTVRLDERTVHHVAKRVAWECLRETFRPMSVSYDRVMFGLDRDVSMQSQIEYLERRLRLVQFVGAGRDKIKFTLDPLAEYLAALHLVESNGKNEQRWTEFLAHVDEYPDASLTLRGFLLAVHDCCVARRTEYQIPEFVDRAIGRRLALVEAN